MTPGERAELDKRFNEAMYRNKRAPVGYPPMIYVRSLWNTVLDRIDEVEQGNERLRNENRRLLELL